VLESWHVCPLVTSHLLAHFLSKNLRKLLWHVKIKPKDVLRLLLAQLSGDAGCGLNRRSVAGGAGFWLLRLLTFLQVIGVDGELWLLRRALTVGHQTMNSHRLQGLKRLLLNSSISNWVIVLVVTVLP